MSSVKARLTNPAPGWIARGSHPEDYDMGSDRQVIYTGKASRYIKNRAKKPQGFGTLMQSFSGKPYLNERINMLQNDRLTNNRSITTVSRMSDCLFFQV